MLPQLIVFGLAMVLILGDAFFPRRSHYTVLTGISLVGYAAALISLYWQRDNTESTFRGMFRADGLTLFLSLTILSAAILSVMVSASYVEFLEGRMPLGEFYVLLSFAVLGALMTAAAGDLVMIFVGIELSSLATYVLTAFAKRRETSMEGALKYFLLGIFASAILVYGMAWIYGLTARPTSTPSRRAWPKSPAEAVASRPRSSSPSCSWSSAWASRSRRCPSTCGRRTPTTAHRPR